MHNLSKYTVPTSLVGMAVPIKLVGMFVVLAVPTKTSGMQHAFLASEALRLKLLFY